MVRDQTRAARNFVVEYCSHYDQDHGSRIMQEALDDFKDEVNDRISGLEQTVKDLLQLVRITLVSFGVVRVKADSK
jgi:hypothetical protein